MPSPLYLGGKMALRPLGKNPSPTVVVVVVVVFIQSCGYTTK